MTAKLPTLQSNAYWPLLQYDWNTWLYTRIKRAVDVLVAAVALVLLAPLFAAVAVAIKLDSPGPVIFRQQRVRGDQLPDIERPEENTFTFFKFRSMVANADTKVHQKYVQALINGQAACQGKGLYKLTQDKRITRVGAFIRRTSIDELPQLFNVLRGDMTLVGPRPALPYEVSVYKPWHRVRLSVTPGLTGLWVVEGRNKLAFDEMVRFDVAYARRRSLALDASILARTVPAIFGGTGA